MLVENTTEERIKFPVKGLNGIPNWITIRPGEKKEVPDKYVEIHGLTEVKKTKAIKSKVGKKKVETKVLGLEEEE